MYTLHEVYLCDTYSVSEGVLQVSNQILFIFDTDGQADEVVMDTESFPLFLSDGGMGRDGRVLGKALKPSQALSKGEHLEAGEEGAGLLQAALDVEGDHAAESAHLLLSDLVLGVGRQAGVQNLLNVGA